jgi:hypothetical protein
MREGGRPPQARGILALMKHGRISLGGLAVAGAIAGHALTYAAAVPSRDARDAFLAQSGHAYWPVAVAAAAVAGLAATVAFVARSMRAEDRPGAAGLVVRLAVAQVLLFCAVEVAERISAGRALATLGAHNLLVIGILVQVGVAALVALALRLLARAAIALARALRTPRPRDALAHRPALRTSARPRPLVLAGASGVRGPPA